MIRTVCLLSFLSLAACVSTPPPGTEAAPPVESDSCGSGAFAGLVGGSSFEALQALIPRTSATPPTARVIFPDTAVTLDFRDERLNVEIGTDDIVTGIYCG